MTIEDSELERRVLAHERILQVLIARVDEAEPKFMDRLEATFARRHVLGEGEHDFTAAEQYAEQFLRQTEAPGDERRRGVDSFAPNVITTKDERGI